MKISIGTNIKEGPWGGGNLFAINLKRFLIQKGHDVVFDLDDEDIDIILLTEPRKTSESSAYTHKECIDYKKYVKHDTIVIHRINECDERKNTNFVNKYMIFANKVADYTVFVSTWLKNLYLSQGLENHNLSTILGGADGDIFNRSNFNKFNGQGKIKLVTHHWGANWNKGFDVYSKLDFLLYEKKWSEVFEFTYIGNLPKNFQFNNVKYVKPLAGADLAKELSKHNLYITASINEPSGNHHMEGGLCGLPLMYVDSGGITEYCKDYGLAFDIDSLESKILYFKNNFKTYNDKMKVYPFTSNQMCENYLNLFIKAYSNKDKSKKFNSTQVERKIYNLKKRINSFNNKISNHFPVK
jgi:hypothetical protein